MVQVARLIGGAGTGKTTALLELMDLALETYKDPFQVGFCSFTRAARREASSRAGDKYGVKAVDLERGGWFRTIHSICYRCLGVGKELITQQKGDREWLEEALSEKLGDGSGGANVEDDWYQPAMLQTDATKALSLWDCSRNRTIGLPEIHAAYSLYLPDLPSLDFCRKIVEKYELVKRLDGRCDFVDLLARFGGYHFTVEGCERCEPQGVPPDVPVWLLDEQQDASPLLHGVCRRLVEDAVWCYIVGDPMQSIYGFAGADPHLFLGGWGDCKEKIMPRSWRCPRTIHELGERVLENCSDYWDRKIAPADHDGRIENHHWRHVAGLVNPTEDWLVLARTNYLAARLARALDGAGIPWRPTKGHGRWDAPQRLKAIQALKNLEANCPISGSEWAAILSQTKVKANGEALYVRGTKKDWLDLTEDQADDKAGTWVLPEHLGELGATAAFLKQVRAGLWRGWVARGHDVSDAIDKHGYEAVEASGVRLGTVHSAKGMEADNVALLTTIPMQVENGKRTTEGANEEHRVSYVGVTRARRRLALLDEPCGRARRVFKMEICP